MSIFSAIAPSSKSIQKEYVDKRMRQLKRETSADSPKIRELILRLQAKHHVNPTLMPWTKTYTRLLMAMSMGDLTINLDAGDWFMKATPNTFATYKQTYERAQQRLDVAARLAGHARASYAAQGVHVEDADAQTLAKIEQQAAAALGPARCDELVAQGRALDAAAAAELVLGWPD